MTDIQSRILLLMDEITDICEKENLKYVVSNLTSAYIQKHKKFEDMQCYFNIAMPFADAVKLQKYVDKNMSDKRVVESLNNNNELSMIKFRYVDRNSLLIDGGSTVKYKYRGIFINISVTREFEPGNDVRGIERYVQLMNFHEERMAKWLILFKFATRITHINLFRRFIMRYTKLENTNYIHYGYLKRNKMTKAEMIDYVYNENLKATKPYRSKRYLPDEQRYNPDVQAVNCLAYVDDKSNVLKFPIDFYTNVKKVEFEGRTFNVYAEIEKYYETLYGADWSNKIQEDILGSDRSTFIYDTEVPFEEYLEYTKNDEYSLDDIIESKKVYNRWMGKVHNPAVNKTQHTFMMARRSVERIDTWYKLRNKREKLREAYENKDIPKLKKLMSGYLSATQRYLNEKIGFYIDDELFKYATLIWEDEGKPGRTDKEGNELTYAQYVYSFVPDLYKNETPDEYFAKRGKKFD